MRSPDIRLFHRHTAAVSIAAVGLAVLAPAGSAAVATPQLLAPSASGGPLDTLPIFKWKPVAGADHYELQVSGDDTFSSPELHAEGVRNASYAFTQTQITGTAHWWRVRAISASGAQSGWATSTFSLRWSGVATPISPVNRLATNTPANPLTYSEGVVFHWQPVAGAASYRLQVSTDPAFATLVFSDFQGKGIDTHGTSYAPQVRLTPDTHYYWRVIPLDADQHTGTTSPRAEFDWVWPSSTTTRIAGVASGAGTPTLYQPRFEWDAVDGAASYDVEISDTAGFTDGGRVGSIVSTIAHDYTPVTALADNDDLFWRVRAVDPDGHKGRWNNGPSFREAFGVATPHSVSNAHMRTNVPAAVDTDSDPSDGYQTDTPVISWDPVPEATEYEVQVAPYWDVGGRNDCDYQASTFDTRWRDFTVATSWTPLAHDYTNPPVTGTDVGEAPSLPSHDGPALTIGQAYCARVRPLGPELPNGSHLVGDWTDVMDPVSAGDPAVNDGVTAFTFSGYPSGGSCTAPCTSGYLGAADYLEPGSGTHTLTPLLTWNPIAGAQSYWVIVASDATFHTIVDWALTRVPAYSPRNGESVQAYKDETAGQGYYWMVLPAPNPNGGGAPRNITLARPQTFDKLTGAPVQESPIGTTVSGQPTFSWDRVEGANQYLVQVSQDGTDATDSLLGGGIVNGVHGVTATASTTYTSPDTTYPAGKTLYWRVAATDAEDNVLSWSDWQTFQKTLPPVTGFDASPASPSGQVPLFTWDPAPGAVGYHITVEQPNNGTQDFDLATAAFTPSDVWGTGTFTWSVYAKFPKNSGSVNGPVSAEQQWTRTISAPIGETSVAAPGSIALSWTPAAGASSYRVQISRSLSFGSTIEDSTTKASSFTPAMTAVDYADGGTLYWRVAARDSHDYAGAWSATRSITLPKRIYVVASPGYITRGTAVTISVRTRDYAGHAIGGVKVKLSGAHLTPVVKTSSSSGTVKFRVVPKRTGKITLSATRSGYGSGSTTVSIY